MGNENMTASPSGTFRTGDGLLNIAANKQEQYVTLCRLVGREELACDSRFADREARKRNREALTVELERALAARSAADWERRLNSNGVPSGRVRTVPEVLEHPQVVQHELVKRVPDAPGVDRPLSVLRSGFRLASGDPSPCGAPPALGADNASVFSELGISAQELEALHGKGIV